MRARIVPKYKARRLEVARARKLAAFAQRLHRSADAGLNRILDAYLGPAPDALDFKSAAGQPDVMLSSGIRSKADLWAEFEALPGSAPAPVPASTRRGLIRWTLDTTAALLERTALAFRGKR